MDYLEITALSLAAQIGVHEWEQRIKQRLIIDLTIQFDCSQCNDELEKTIDYDAICQRVTAFVESRSFKLIETVAESVAELVKREFAIARLCIRVSKPNAIKNAGNISVKIER